MGIRLPAMVLLACTASSPAFADLSAKQQRLLDGLPTAEQVIAATPQGANPIETGVLQWAALARFTALVEEVSGKPMPLEARPYYQRFNSASWDKSAETIKRMKAGSQEKMLDMLRVMFPTPQQYQKFHTDLFAATLTGDLRDYVDAEYADLNAQAQSYGVLAEVNEKRRSGIVVPLRDLARASYAQLQLSATAIPTPWNKYASKVLSVPLTVWLGLLVAWLILGIALRTTPFGASPDDPLLIQRGRKRFQLEARASTVLNVDERIEKRVYKHVRIERDKYGNEIHYPSERTETTHHLRAFIQNDDGTQDTINLTNIAMDVMKGQRLLAVFDQKSRHYVLFYNRDLQRPTYMPYMKHVCKMRPLILLPLWILATLAADLISPQAAAVAFLATPVVYLPFVWIVNSRRYKKFRETMVPAILAAASGNSRGAQAAEAELRLA